MSENQALIFFGSVITLCSASIIAVSLRRSPSGNFFTFGNIAAAFFLVYFSISMFDMAVRRDGETILYAGTENEFIAAAIWSSIGIIIFTIIYALPTPSSVSPTFSSSIRPESIRPLIISSLASLAIGSLAKLYLVTQYGASFSELMLNLSSSQRELSDIQLSSFVLTIASFFDCGLLGLIFSLFLMRKKHLGLILLLCAIGIGETFILGGKRITAILFILAPFLWFQFFSKKSAIRIATLAAIAGCILIFGGLLFRIIAPNLAIGSSNHVDSVLDIAANPVSFYLDQAELSIFEMTTLALTERDAFISGQNNGPTLLAVATASGLLFLIPRAIAPWKPEPFDFSHLAYTVLTGKQGIGLAIGPFGVGYIWGGYAGLIITAVILALIARHMDSIIKRITLSLLFALPFLLIVFFTLLRFGAPGFVIVYIYQSLLPAVIFYAFIRFFEARINTYRTP